MATTSTTTTPTSSAIHHCVTLIQWLDSTYPRACVSNNIVGFNTIMLGNMPAGRLNPTIGFGGKGRCSVCAVRCRDVAIYRRLEDVPVDEVGVQIQQLTSPQKKHTPDPTAHKRLKETHDPCAFLVPVGNMNRY